MMDIKNHLMDTKATHLRVLTRYAMFAPRGSVIAEMGCGYYSTFVLSEICQARGIDFQVYYSDEDWAGHIRPSVTAQWMFTDWIGWDCPKAFLTLLDNEQSVAARSTHLPLLLKRNVFVIIHDAEHYRTRANNILSKYSERMVVYDMMPPNTMVLRGDQ